MRPHESVVMGHEFSGRVLDYGPCTRKSWASGTPVVSLPMIRVRGKVQMTGLSAKAPGAYAERVLVQESLTMDVPNGLSPETAALTEPLAVAWHAVRRSGVRKRETAVVIGCGPIGLAVILMLKARGVQKVVASDFSPGRRALAEVCGADMVFDPGVDSPWTGFEQSRYFTDANDLPTSRSARWRSCAGCRCCRGGGCSAAAEAAGATPRGPVVFECVGVPGIINQIVNEAPLASRVVVVGVCMEQDTFQPAMAINKELDLRFAFVYQPHEFRETLQMIADGTVDPTPLVTGDGRPRRGLGGVRGPRGPGATRKDPDRPGEPGRRRLTGRSHSGPAGPVHWRCCSRHCSCVGRGVRRPRLGLIEPVQQCGLIGMVARRYDVPRARHGRACWPDVEVQDLARGKAELVGELRRLSQQLLLAQSLEVQDQHGDVERPEVEGVPGMRTATQLGGDRRTC